MTLQAVDFPFGGTDEGTDSRVLPMPRMTKVQNMRRAKDGAWKRRTGWVEQALTDNESSFVPDRPRRLGKNGAHETLYCNNYNFALSFDRSNLTQISSGHCLYPSEFYPIAMPNNSSNPDDPVHCSTARSGGLVCVVFRVNTGSLDQAVAVAFDATTRKILARFEQDVHTADYGSARVLGFSDRFVVFFVSAGGRLQYRRILTATSANVAAGFSTAANLPGITGTNHAGPWDVCRHSSSEYTIVYQDAGAPQTRIARLDSSHSLLASVNLSATLFNCAIYSDPTLGVNVLRSDGTLNHWTESFTGGTTVAAGLGGDTRAIVNLGGDSLWLADFTLSTALMRVVRVTGVTSALSASSIENVRNVVQLTKPWNDGSGVVYIGATEHRESGHEYHYIMCCGTNGENPKKPMTVAYIGYGRAKDPALSTNRCAGNEVHVDGTDAFLALPLATQPEDGVYLARFALDDPRAYHLAHLGGLEYVANGGTLRNDGYSLVPNTLPAPVFSVAENAGTGSLSAGTYQIAVVWEWNDQQGNRHLSAVATKAITVGANASIEATVNTLPGVLLGRSTTAPGQLDDSISHYAPRIVGYISDAGGQVLRRGAFTEPNNVTTVNTLTVTFNGSFTPTETLYTTGGALPHIPEPLTVAIARHGSRVFGVDRETNSIWYTSEASADLAPSRQDGLSLYVPHLGELTAVASQQARLLVFSRDQITSFYGVGPDDLGAGAFDGPIDLVTEVGCTDARSIVSDPLGNLYFQSRRGIEILVPGAQAPELISDPVKDTLGTYGQVMSALCVDDDDLVMFFCSPPAGSGAAGDRILLYHYRERIWSTDVLAFVSHSTELVSAFVDSGDLVAINDMDGSLWINDGTAYEDDSESIAATLETGDMHFESMSGFDRVRYIVVSGQWFGGCDLAIRESHDGGLNWVSNGNLAALSSGFSSLETIRARYDLVTQKTSGVRFQFELFDSGGVGTEAIALNGLTAFAVVHGDGPRLWSARRI